MARNFIIVYSGREGSSAIIRAFANRTDIAIPVIEEFDEYQCIGMDKGAVPIILHRMFTTARFSADAHVPPVPAVPVPSQEKRSVGFKWRIWGEPERIAEVLREHDVFVFELLRSDILNVALSLYLTTYVLPLEQEARFAAILTDPNPQFRIRWLERREQDEVIGFIRSREFSVDVARLVAIMKQYAASKQVIRSRYIELFETFRLDVQTLYYEDFLSDAAGFLGGIGSLLGASVDRNQELFYPKINRNDIRSQITNLAEVEASRDVQQIKLAYYSTLVTQPVGRRTR
jgi:hypothetical protein